MAVGSKNAFANIQPVNDPLAGAITFADDVFARKRKEDADKLAIQKKEEESKLKDYADWDGKFDPKIIGNSSIDDPLIGMAMTAKNRVADINKELYSTTDFRKKAELMSERNKMLQSFEVANQTPALIKEKVKQLEEGIKQGKYNPRDVDFMLKISEQIESGKFELNYDDRGVAKIKIYDTDENGQPKGILKETSLGDLVNAYNPKLAFNYEGYKDTTLKNVKPEGYGSQSGSIVVKGTRISDANLKQAETFANVIINDPNKLYEAQYLFQEKDPVKLKEKLEEDFITSIATEREQSLDTGYLNYQRGVQKDKEKEARYKVVDIPDPFLSPSNQYRPASGFKAVSVSNPKTVDFIKGYSLPKLNSYTVADVNGEKRILAEITYPDIKGSTLTKEDESNIEKVLAKLGSSNTSPEEKEDAKLELSRITKGAEIKTEVVLLDEADAYKLGANSGINGGQEEMIKLVEEKGSKTKTERETWESATPKTKPKVNY